MSDNKIIGGILGAIIGGPIGAGIGVFLGACADDEEKTNKIPTGTFLLITNKTIYIQCPHCLKGVGLREAGTTWLCGGCHKEFRFSIEQKNLQEEDCYNRRIFILTFFSILGRMTACDGNVANEEEKIVNQIAQSFQFSNEEYDLAKEGFTIGLENSDYGYAAHTLLQVASFEEKFGLRLIIDLLRISFADGVFHENERRFVFEIATKFVGMSLEELEKLTECVLQDMFPAQNNDKHIEQAFIALDCHPYAPFDEVKKRYKELCLKFHPDRIQGKGLPQEFIDFAKNKFQEINNSFELIKSYYLEKNAA